MTLTCPDEPKVRVCRSGACFVFPHLFTQAVLRSRGNHVRQGSESFEHVPNLTNHMLTGAALERLPLTCFRCFRYFRALLPLDNLRRRPWFKCLLESLEENQNRYITTSVIPHQSRVYNLPRSERNVSLFRVPHLFKAICPEQTVTCRQLQRNFKVFLLRLTPPLLQTIKLIYLHQTQQQQPQLQQLPHSLVHRHPHSFNKNPNLQLPLVYRHQPLSNTHHFRSSTRVNLTQIGPVSRIQKLNQATHLN